jgi:hypothetical protein
VQNFIAAVSKIGDSAFIDRQMRIGRFGGQVCNSARDQPFILPGPPRKTSQMYPGAGRLQCSWTRQSSGLMAD